MIKKFEQTDILGPQGRNYSLLNVGLCIIVDTNISYEITASIFRVQEKPRGI